MTIKRQIELLLSHRDYAGSKMKLAIDLTISTKTLDRILLGYKKLRPIIVEKIQSTYDSKFKEIANGQQE